MEAAIFIGIFAIFVIVLAWQQRRKDRRRSTLHQDSSGQWFWIEYDGSEWSSPIHPDAPGGAWYSDNSSNDGGGFDGGGDGGGGGD